MHEDRKTSILRTLHLWPKLASIWMYVAHRKPQLCEYVIPTASIYSHVQSWDCKHDNIYSSLQKSNSQAPCGRNVSVCVTYLRTLSLLSSPLFLAWSGTLPWSVHHWFQLTRVGHLQPGSHLCWVSEWARQFHFLMSLCGKTGWSELECSEYAVKVESLQMSSQSSMAKVL